MKLFKALLCRAITVDTQYQLNALLDDISWLYRHERIKGDEHEILIRLLDRIHPDR